MPPVPRVSAPALLAVAVLISCLATRARAGADETFKLTASDGAVGDRLGHSVALSGSTAIVGAWTDDDQALDSGSAYMFNTATGQKTFKLIAKDGKASDYFGNAVALSGNTAIVGAYGHDGNGPNSGSAYLFNASTGQQTAKLTPRDTAANDLFGNAVGISGTTAIVGAFRDDDNGSDSGSAYLFNTLTGVQTAKLTPNDAAAQDGFGYSVGISDTTAIVGARYDDAFANSSGSAYLFDTTTGTQIAKLTPEDPFTSKHFGASVAISGSIAIVGALHDPDSISPNGSAYLFDTTTGNQFAKLLPNDSRSGRDFGHSVGISGTTAIVGAYGSNSAFLFDTTTGKQLGRRLAASDAADDEFGFSVAISGTTSLVGARYDDDNAASASGSAYIFGTDKLDAVPITGGVFEFTVDAHTAATLDDVLVLTNTGDTGTVVNIFGFTLTGGDASLFNVLGFSTASLRAGDPAMDSAAFDLAFIGAPIGNYAATLTIQTDSGNVTYALSAAVPEPASLTILAAMLAITRRRLR